MSHYFTNDDTLQSDKREVKFFVSGRELSFISDVGVFSKNNVDFGTKTLIDCAIKEKFSGRGLDLGCGIGVIGITMSIINPNVVFDMVDINERAVNLAKENSAKYSLDDQQFIAVSDSCEKVVKTNYDVILTNPPIRAGKKVVYKFFDDAFAHLRTGGLLYVVIQKKQGAPSAKEKLTTLFGNCELIERNKGYHILKCVK